MPRRRYDDDDDYDLDRPRRRQGGMPTWLIVLLAVGIPVLTIVVSCGGLFAWVMVRAAREVKEAEVAIQAEMAKQQAEAAQDRQATKITAAALHAEFVRNRNAAEQKYVGKLLRVTGKCLKNEAGTLTLEADPRNAGIIVGLAEDHLDDFEGTEPGEEVEVIGTCLGVKLDRQARGGIVISLGKARIPSDP